MRTYAELQKEVEVEKSRRNLPNVHYRDNLVFLLQAPEHNNYMLFGYEFDAGFRTTRYCDKYLGAVKNFVEYNLYHANTLVTFVTTGRAYPTAFDFRVNWTKEPWEVKKEKTELFTPPYSNIQGPGTICMGVHFDANVPPPKDYAPEGLHKYHSSILNWILFNGVWTDSVPDLAHRICTGAVNQGPAAGRFADWEKRGDKALEQFQWHTTQGYYKTLEDLFAKKYKESVAYKGR